MVRTIELTLTVITLAAYLFDLPLAGWVAFATAVMVVAHILYIIALDRLCAQLFGPRQKHPVPVGHWKL